MYYFFLLIPSSFLNCKSSLPYVLVILVKMSAKESTNPKHM